MKRFIKRALPRILGTLSVLVLLAFTVVALNKPRDEVRRDELGRELARVPADLSDWRFWLVNLGIVGLVLLAAALGAWQDDGPGTTDERKLASNLIGLGAGVATFVVAYPALVDGAEDDQWLPRLLPLLLLTAAAVGVIAMTAAVVLAAIDVLGDRIEAGGGRVLAWWYRRKTFPWLWYLFWSFVVGVPAGLATALTGSSVFLAPTAAATTMLVVRWLGARWRVRQQRVARFRSNPNRDALREFWLTRPLDLMRHQAMASGYGVFLGTGGDHWEFSPHEHSVLVLGPPRSGKTSSIVIPSLLCHTGPAVSTSTKTDVLRATAKARADLRQTWETDPTPPPGPYQGCYLFDPTGSVTSPVEGVEMLRWSPLTGCSDWLVARRRAASMAGAARPAGGSGVANEGHWTERATALMAPLLHVAAVRGDSMATFVDWINSHDLDTALEYLEEAPAGVNGLAMPALLGMKRTAERELSGIWSTAAGVVACYQSDAALATTEDPNFDPARWLANNETIYIAASGEQQRMAAPIVVGLLDDLRRAVYAGQLEDQKPARALFALDEVANIAPIRELPAMASEGGGQGLTLLACFQDLSQIATGWPAQASGFLTLFNTNVIFRGIKEARTLELISQLFGEHEVEKQSYSSPDRNLLADVTAALNRQSLPRGSSTISFLRQRRVPVDQVARGYPGQVIVLNGAEAPDWINLASVHTASPWREITADTLPTEALPDEWWFHNLSEPPSP